MLIVDTIVDVGVGTGAFVGLVMDANSVQTLIHMDGRIKAGSRVVIKSHGYQISATTISCLQVGDSYEICFDLDQADSAFDCYEWPMHARKWTNVA